VRFADRDFFAIWNHLFFADDKLPKNRKYINFLLTNIRLTCFYFKFKAYFWLLGQFSDMAFRSLKYSNE
jgi:hypothetical protein